MPARLAGEGVLTKAQREALVRAVAPLSDEWRVTVTAQEVSGRPGFTVLVEGPGVSAMSAFEADSPAEEVFAFVQHPLRRP
jgi:hypothetical protein